MKPLQISRDFVPLSRFKARASQIFHQLREDRRPVVVTQNGQPAGVLISPEDYDVMQNREQFLSAVGEGLADSNAGRLVDDEVLTKELEADLGK